MKSIVNKIDVISSDLGINADEIAARKAYLDFGTHDVEILTDLHKKLGKTSPEFIAGFYSHLLSFDELRVMLPDLVIERLRVAQMNYFDELTAGNYDQDYVINRLKVGLVHQMVGLEPKWYLGAYNKYVNDLLPELFELYHPNKQKVIDVIRALMKVVFLDMGLALETYFHADHEEIVKTKDFADQIIACMPIGLVALDKDSCILRTNSAFNNIFGLGNMSPVGLPVTNFIPEKEIRKHVEHVARTGEHEHAIMINIKSPAGNKIIRASFSPTMLHNQSACLIMLEDLTHELHLQNEITESEMMIRSILANAVDGIVTINDKGIIESFNPAAEAIFGYSTDEVIGQNVKILMPEKYATDHDQYLDTYKRTGQGKILGVGPREVIGKHKNGTTFPMDLATSEMPVGESKHFIGIVRDISKRKSDQESMRTLYSVVEQTADLVMITACDGIITYVNSAFQDITGYKREEVLGQKPSILKSGKHSNQFYFEMWNILKKGNVFSDVLVNKKKDGSFYYEEKTITPLRDSSGNVLQYVSTGKDVSERMQVQEHFHHLANHDLLTDLPNRLMLIDRIKQAMLRGHWHERDIALMFLDLDRFKVVNDTLGHDAGDLLLREIAERLTENVRDGDTVSRLGGDEFVILLTDIANMDDISTIAEKILAGFKHPFLLQEQEVYISASIGISCFPADGEDPQTLLKNADVAMYRVKETGKNNYQFFSSDMTKHAFEKLHLETNLRQALENNEFVLYYQPQVEISSGQIVAAEALIRWQHPDMGLVPPMEFIPVLEETGLIEQVGEWVFRQACADNAALFEAGGTLNRISINLSPRQFRAKDLCGTLQRIANQSKINCTNLELEITESVLMENADATINILQKLRSLGIRIAVDDFGTGYSSLAYLKRFPIDTLKIDRTFVSDIPHDSDSISIVNAIISMAHALGKEVVAEGVETQAQLDFLREKNCKLFQGYYYSRPVTHEQLIELIKNNINVP